MTHSPPALLDTDLDDWLQPVLDAARLDEAGLEALAKATGALQRRRVVRTPRQLLQLLLLYVISDASLRDVAAYGALMGLPLSDEAVRQRFHAAEAFVVALMGRLFAAELDRPEARRVLLFDATVLSQPGSHGTDVRCHTLMALDGDAPTQVLVTDRHVAESLLLCDLHRGDLVLADSELCRAAEIQTLSAAGVDVLVRFRSHRWPGHPAEPWLVRLQKQPAGHVSTFPLQLPNGNPVYVHVLTLSEAQAAEARRKKRRAANKKKGKAPSRLTLALCGYVMVLTTVPPERMSAEQALGWYRRRWQVELLFKRQKSLLGLAHLHSKAHSPLTRVKVWMKLLYTWLVDHGARATADLAERRPRSPWRAWRLARETLCARLWLPLLGWRALQDLVLHALDERSRRRTLQTRAHDLLEALAG